ncbi:MAG: hypothetical protein E6I55_07955 [Chloroflexi bacterium]|nr:MAG: hypothetical protein E6I55_07955 [Chloroflexota bacterium]
MASRIALRRRSLVVVCSLLLAAGAAMFPGFASATSSAGPAVPTWWAKYQTLLHQTSTRSAAASTPTLSVGANVDISNEDGPQSETSIAIDPVHPKYIVAGSNEINRLPMRGYFSADGGSTWGAVDLPLPPASSTNGVDFGSDPTVAFDTRGNVYYGYIVVFFNRFFASIQGSEMAVAKSSDHGATWAQVTFFNFNSGSGKFNDKPMIAVDSNLTSPFRDSVYAAWDNASPRNGKSSANDALLVSRSTDGGTTFSAPISVSTNHGGPSAVIGADPFVGPNGEVYVAWQDAQNSQVTVNGSFDGGVTFGQPVVIAPTVIPFAIAAPAEATRGVLIYPSCDADRSSGSLRGTLYCSWADQTTSNGLDIFLSRSTDRGATWSAQRRVNDDPTGVVHDQFYNWLAADAVTGAVDLSWYDTRNDPNSTKTDVYATSSSDGGATFAHDTRVTTVMSDESAANPCAQTHDQYGDYEGIAAHGGSIHPVWTDARFDCTVDYATGNTIGEEVFSATITAT